MLATDRSAICELLVGAREQALARPVLMHMLWAGDALVDVAAPIVERSCVWAPTNARV